ncbi:hypothetical protein QR685DRAFT_120606 [Neurospora intermedia]|uniref:Uncharacterized protein n=1 Tax=Neurospora intermedia TaxID=5142 RepID=A0ABR3D0D1_NEUIN
MCDESHLCAVLGSIDDRRFDTDGVLSWLPKKTHAPIDPSVSYSVCMKMGWKMGEIRKEGQSTGARTRTSRIQFDATTRTWTLVLVLSTTTTQERWVLVVSRAGKGQPHPPRVRVQCMCLQTTVSTYTLQYLPISPTATTHRPRARFHFHSHHIIDNVTRVCTTDTPSIHKHNRLPPSIFPLSMPLPSMSFSIHPSPGRSQNNHQPTTDCRKGFYGLATGLGTGIPDCH